MKVYVDVHDSGWNKYKVDFQKIVNAVGGAKSQDAEVSIILVDDDEIREINKTYRGMDKATNVLSFELGDEVLLGDIYIALGTVEREARDAKISVADHAAHMVVHGMLHLMGYDHIADEDAIVMEMKEIKILKKLGIKNPYEDISCECCACDVKSCPGDKIRTLFSRVKVRRNSWVQYALYALFGGVASLGFAPFYQWWWTVIGLAGAYWLTVRNDDLGGFWQSLLRVAPFGAMYAVANFWWVLHSIYVVPEIAQQFAIWTVPGVIGLAIAGVFIFSWPFVVVAQKKLSPVGRALMFACVWALVLWGREWILTGFPWNPIANITMPFPFLANSMSVWGALGLSFLIVAFVALIVEMLENMRIRTVWAMLGVIIGLICGGCWLGYKNIEYASVGAGADMPIVRIVQPAISQSQKATHNREQAILHAQQNLQNMLNLAYAPGNPDVIVLPETAYPFVVMQDDSIDIARALQRPVVFGATTFDMGRLFNSMVVADVDGNIKHIYSKSHLVPFGEYSPLGILPSPVNLSRGNGPDILDVDGFVFAPAVCYEVIFSGALLPDNADGVFAIVNITNDNWFGNTPGVYQHLDMVRRYAIESGLPIIRANYSGISAFVSADGTVMSSLPVGEQGVLDGIVFGAHNTLYRALGLNTWMIIILVFSIVGIYFTNKSR